MKRLYFPYTMWEDWQNGMWRQATAEETPSLVEKALIFTSDADAYGRSMMRVLSEWPVSCMQNLTNTSMNRQAWVGHAGACLEHGLPEHITRAAWWLLTEEQRDAANAKADIAIAEFERTHNDRCPK